MKKSHAKYLYILLFTIISAQVFGNPGEGDKNPNQNNSKLRYDFLNKKSDDLENFKDQTTLDIQFLGIGLGYKKRIADRMFLGVQIGGPFLFGKWIVAPSFTADDEWMSELFKGGIFIHYLLTENWNLELGINHIIYEYDNSISGKNVSFGFFRKAWKYQIGTKINIGKSENGSSLAYSSLIIFRKSLNKW